MIENCKYAACLVLITPEEVTDKCQELLGFSRRHIRLKD